MAREQGWYEPDDEVDAHLPYLNPRPRLGRHELARERALVLAAARAVRAAGDARARGRRGEGVGGAAPRPARASSTSRPTSSPTRTSGSAAARSTRSASARSRVCRPTVSTSRSPRAPSTSSTASPRSTTRSTSARWSARWRASRAAAGAVCRAERGHAGARAPAATSTTRSTRRSFGINEHVHTLYAYLWAFARAGLVVRRVEQAEGYDDLREPADRRAAAAAAGWSAAARRPCSPRPATATRASRSTPVRLGTLDWSRVRLRRPLRYRELFGNLFRRDLQARYKGIGARRRWSLAEPAAADGIYLLVFSVLWKVVDDRALPAVPARRARASGSSSPRR